MSLVTPQFLVLGHTILWVVLLIHCLVRRELFPVFSTHARTKIFWLATFLLVHPVFTLWYLLFGVLARAKWKYRRWQTVLIVTPVLLAACLRVGPIVADYVPAADPVIEIAPANLSGHITATEANTNSTFSRTTSSSEHDFFIADDVLVFHREDHPLLRAIATYTAVALRDTGKFTSVRLSNQYPIAGDDDRLPDLYFGLALTDHSVTNLPGHRKDTIRLRLTGGSAPYSSNHSYRESFSPPLQTGTLDGSVEYDGAMWGWTLGKTRTDLLAEDIAKSVEKQIMTTVDEWAVKSPPVPEIPETFYGTYRSDVPDLPFDESQVEHIMSGAHMFHHNRSMWRIDLDDESKAVLQTLQDALVEHGWDTPSETREEERIRLTRGEDVLEAFKPTRRHDDPLESEPILIVDYQDRFDQDELKEILEPLLANGTSLDTLIHLQHHYKRVGLHSEWGRAIENHPPTSAHSAKALSKWYESQERMEEARWAMQQAMALNKLTMTNPIRFKEDETLGLSTDTSDYFTPEVLDSLGAVRIDPATLPTQHLVTLVSPFIMYLDHPDLKHPMAQAITVTMEGTEGVVSVTDFSMIQGGARVAHDSYNPSGHRRDFHVLPGSDEYLTPLSGTLEQSPEGELTFTIEARGE